MSKYSEFEGQNTPSGIRVNPLGNRRARKASDLLRLVYRTGTTSVDRKPDGGRAFHGYPPVDPVVPPSRIPK